MADITQIPEQELLDDFKASIEDIKHCKTALVNGVYEYGDGKSVKDRLEVNRKIVQAIGAELNRRNIPF